MLSTIKPTEHDIHLFHEGNLFKSHELFGAHLVEQNGQQGVRFSVWAPSAQKVAVVGDFNNWSGAGYEFEKINEQGIWSLFVAGLSAGTMYKYEIHSSNGKIILKADPYAFFSELRPNTASVVADLSGYKWNDQSWFRKKKVKSTFEKPLSIYELHMGSWRKHKDDTLYSYVEMAEELIPYLVEHQFSHVELLPVIEHPYDRSWGYQGTGYFSPTSRYGSPKDFMYFIDQCHQHSIGVILDWVPGHFCKDEHGLYMFDGLPTYEYARDRDRENYVWGTANFDLGKPEVQSFLISNAVFWLEHYHVDGFRVDAVANMLYWNNSNELVGNEYAAQFLRKLNDTVHAHEPTALMIAEDSTDWPDVTGPTAEGGLGFSYKWNMGWMNDVLSYMEANVDEREHLHHKITFSLLYAFNEKFILPFSHDEVVHGKRSLLNKMPGDYWRKFAQLRLLYGFFFSHPGKKLLFMGGEFGQFDEWKDLEQLDWLLLDFDMHAKMNIYFKELMKIYNRSKPLFEVDYSPEGFEWIDVNNRAQKIFSFIRKGQNPDDVYVIICNFSEHVHHDYKVGVPLPTSYIEVLNSDDSSYGGSGITNKKELKFHEESYHGKPYHIELNIPAFGINILRAKKSRGEKKKNGQKKMRSNVIGRRKRESTKLSDN
ncbi:1,4-alpha-glucan branching enzyme [Priestia koreensis]|uniref:1,4-alpha-glucan branching enzyme GlgB n=1 Tax=Priestia koreensis TaxID=284581 RepID=A0A0M0L6N0_9BACI|nr:1,4-alpha-glucan branching enzyme [Priestia koreensis]KOO46735.1 glycogen branching protein [Priestia koreensis]